MNFIILISTLIYGIMAKPYLYPVPLQQLQTPLAEAKTPKHPELRSQQTEEQIQHYFTQDALGQYSYGYIEPLSTKQEIRTVDGVTTGSYSYIDANGFLQTVDYKADENGFHVAATNLPKNTQQIPEPVTETAEVAAARAQHLAAHKAILEDNRSASSILPKPVEDTPEVVEAKREFFARFAAEQETQKLLKENALLRSQNVALTSSFKYYQPFLPTLKTNTAFVKSAAKLSSTPETGAFVYGYQIGGAVKPSRYYLPIV